MTELLVTVSPDTLTLNPGESAQVTVTVDPASSSGTGSASITVEVPPQYDGYIIGASAGLVPAGEHWHVTGDVNLTGDLIVEGLLTGIDTFRCQGNGFSVFFQNGGRADLHGKVKARWGPWGCDSTGWLVGDRIAVAPTAVGVYLPSVMTWSGDWASMVRPANSPDVIQADSTIAKPEVANLSQTIVFENLARGLHIHDSGGVMNLSDVKMLNCGTTGVLGSYPIHFHQVGDNARGSLLERVAVEGGRNHAFVPHGSHGIVLRDAVAFDIVDDAYWWDRPPTETDTSNDTHDSLWERPLALWVKPVPGDAGSRLTAFMLGQGDGNKCIGAVAAAVQGKNSAAGFQWPERGEGVWEFSDGVAHNNKASGIFVWQNGSRLHELFNFRVYRVGAFGVHHGAYRNTYHYRDLVISQTGLESMRVNALASPNPGDALIFENVQTDKPLLIGGHNQTSPNPVLYLNCAIPSVKVREHPADGQGGYQRFEDCGLTPVDFDMGPAQANVKPDSIFELVTAGVVTARWAAGVWT